jgi:hypothetical protein
VRQGDQIRCLEVATRWLVPDGTEPGENGAAEAAFSNRSHTTIESLHRLTGNLQTCLSIAAEDFYMACKVPDLFGLIIETNKGSVPDH